MIELIEAVDEPGQHVVLFGERGAGKTSLSAVTSEVLSTTTVTVRVNCQSSDSFSAIWSRVFDEIVLNTTVTGLGFGSATSVKERTLSEALNLSGSLTPDQVRVTLTALARDRPVAVFIDEFDRITNARVHRAFSDLLKSLSDHVVPATIILVGVADNVSELIAEHASVERALNQISMPRMSRDELAEIVSRGFGSVNLDIEPVALNRITTLSQGLPHYTHLLAQNAGAEAVLSTSQMVTTSHVESAISKALERTQESIASLYYRATYSARENLYKQVLLACAAANADERGFFSAASVREALSDIVGRRMDIPQFAMHLNAFSSDRGPVLKKEGSQRKFRYRFVNPLLQPYVLMRGLSDHLIKPELLDRAP